MTAKEIRDIAQAVVQSLDIKDFKGELTAFKYVETQMIVEAGGSVVQNVYASDGEKHVVRQTPNVKAGSENKAVAPAEPDYTLTYFAQHYVIDPDKRQVVMQLLHQKMRGQGYGKSFLLPLRAAMEAGYVMSNIPHKDVVDEFGPVSSSSYSRWIKRRQYEQDEMDAVIGWLTENV